MESLLERAASWASTRGDVAALALVGSWARGAPRADSDVDLVLLTVDPPADRQGFFGKIKYPLQNIRLGVVLTP